MDEADISRYSAERLARLLKPDMLHRQVWRPGDLLAVLRHQLAAPVSSELPTVTPGFSTPDAGGRSFGQLLSEPSPPLNLLQFVKEYAKSAEARSIDSDLNAPDMPREVARLLYYCAIAAALVRLDQRITSLDNNSLEKALRWSLSQTWLDDSLKPTLSQALTRVTDSRLTDSTALL